MAFEAGNYVTVDGYSGVHFYLQGKEQVWVPPTFFDGDEEEFLSMIMDDDEWVDGPNWVAIMVGDDREFIFEEDDFTLVDEDEVCSCGQVGCHAV